MAGPLPVGHVLRVPLAAVVPGPNARGRLSDVDELAASLAALGQQEPLLVYDVGGGRYEVLDGHRRLAAAHRAGLPYVDVVVRRDRGGPPARILRQLAMHTQHRAFDPIAEAEAIHALVFEHGVRDEEVARSLGRSPRWVSGRLGLLVLSQPEREALRSGRMTLAEASSIVAFRRAVADGRIRPRPGGATGALVPIGIGTGKRTGDVARPGRHCPTCGCGRETRRG